MKLRTPTQTQYTQITIDDAKKILHENRHSHLQTLDPTRYTITGLDRTKYYFKCENKTEASDLINYYEKITGKKRS